MQLLENKKVIVTGGMRGIGKAIVKRCLEEGAYVATTYNSSNGKVQELLEELSEYKDKLFITKMNVSDPDEVSKSMEEMIDKLDGLDVLVNNAGITQDNLFFRMTDEQWDSVIKTNLYGPFYTMKNAILTMVAQKHGSIVNVASISGVIGAMGQANYCASKFGVVGLTKSVAKEYAYKNVRVNAVAPGYIETDMVKKMGKSMDDMMKKLGGMQRIGQAEEVADAVVFLASDKSSYITGQVLALDGGMF